MDEWTMSLLQANRPAMIQSSAGSLRIKAGEFVIGWVRRVEGVLMVRWGSEAPEGDGVPVSDDEFSALWVRSE